MINSLICHWRKVLLITISVVVALSVFAIWWHLAQHIGSGGISDLPAWNTLSITGDYNGQDFTLDCDYSDRYAMAQYGDVEVAIYREESEWKSKLFLYRAEFTLDGATYNLSIHSDDLEDIYTYLNVVLGKPKDSGNQSGATITDALGFDVCRVEMEELTPGQYRWHFYVKVDGEEVCVAEQFGYDEPEVWSRDLDEDGVPELICNSTYGDGVQSVIVYRNNNGIIEEGTIRLSYYEEKFGWILIGGVQLKWNPCLRSDCADINDLN